MKAKKYILTALTLSALLSTTAYGAQSASVTEKAATSTSVDANASESDTASAAEEELIEQLTALYMKENDIFDKNKELWDKVFGLMDKDTAEDSQDMDYVDFLISIIDSNKKAFSKKEHKILEKDLEDIDKIEQEIAEFYKKFPEFSASEVVSSDASPEDSIPAESLTFSGVFPAFSGKDFDGNDVSEEIFSKNAVTVLNFWFNGCKPCVTELPMLEKLNQEIKDLGGEVIGINSETMDENQSAIEEAKNILEKQGATYRNISFPSDSEAGKYVSTILAYPTTLLIDRNGNIIGEPFMGGIDEPENYDKLMERILAVIQADSSESISR